ncbi:MAG: DUF805 domain-containing protein [Candidatus Kapaibacterium sp.]|jgi:uncharacterized membrane protein YhaH (DUF805 family)
MYKYLKVFKDWSNFTGRASRNEFWLFILVNITVYLILWLLLEFVGIKWLFGSMVLLFMFVTLIPTISVTVRRLHDIGHSGLLALLYLLPIIGELILIILLLKKGIAHENEYGLITET